ncbi:hypothetical protein D3C73_1570470 [compost metagenome]
MSGSTEEHTAVIGSESKIKMGDFTAAESTIQVAVKPAVLANSKLSRYSDIDVALLEKLF